MNRYLYLSCFLYAFSTIFLSTNLFAAEWHCACGVRPTEVRKIRSRAKHTPRETESARRRHGRYGVV